MADTAKTTPKAPESTSPSVKIYKGAILKDVKPDSRHPERTTSFNAAEEKVVKVSAIAPDFVSGYLEVTLAEDYRNLKSGAQLYIFGTPSNFEFV